MTLLLIELILLNSEYLILFEILFLKMLIAAAWIWSSQICEVIFFFSIPEIHATGFNYQNEDEKVTLSFPSTLQPGRRHGFYKI